MEIKHNLFTRRWLLTSQKMPERWDTARRWQQHGVLRERDFKMSEDPHRSALQWELCCEDSIFQCSDSLIASRIFS
jgi:hypothetical protein